MHIASHPTIPHLLFVSTDQGIFIINIIMSVIPLPPNPYLQCSFLGLWNVTCHSSCRMMPDPHFCCKRDPLLLNTSMAGCFLKFLHLQCSCIKSTKKEIPELATCANTSSFLMLSPSRKYLIVFSYFERFYKLFDTTTWVCWPPHHFTFPRFPSILCIPITSTWPWPDI